MGVQPLNLYCVTTESHSVITPAFWEFCAANAYWRAA